MDKEIILFAKGKLFYGQEKFGSYFINLESTNVFNFSVWAFKAAAFWVLGEFNGWKKTLHPLSAWIDPVFGKNLRKCKSKSGQEKER